MLGVADVTLILVVTTIANLIVEIGAEVFAEWWVNGGSAEASTVSLSSVDIDGCVAGHRDALMPVANDWMGGDLPLTEAAMKIQAICSGVAI